MITLLKCSFYVFLPQACSFDFLIKEPDTVFNVLYRLVKQLHHAACLVVVLYSLSGVSRTNVMVFIVSMGHYQVIKSSSGKPFSKTKFNMQKAEQM